MRYPQRVLREGLTALALLALAPCALAQPMSVAEIATYQGADREQRLIEGAKREKELTFYSSIPPDDIAALVSAFDRKYGVKVKVWRADSEGFLQRVVGEARARRFEVDVMAGSSSALEPLYRENLLQEVRSPNLAGVIPQAIAPHRQWVAVYLSTIVQAYNTDLIRKESLPKTYYDLLRPQWKDKLGIEAEDFDWFAQVVMDFGETQGLRLFRDIVASNGMSVRKGHSLLTNLVAAGEVPLALTVYGFLAEQAKVRGAPLDWFVIPPAIARATGEGLARNAPSEIKKDYNVPNRLRTSIQKNPLAWAIGALVTGFLISRIPARRKKIYLWPESSPREPPPELPPAVSKRAGSRTGKVWSLIKPVISAYIGREIYKRVKRWRQETAG
jgi:iron(III) transport system substrate-binding protein